MPEFAIPLAALAVSAGSAVYSGVQASDAQDKQASANAEAMKRADEQLKLAKDQQTKQEADIAQQQADQQSADARVSARARQRAQAIGAYGRDSTILTSPLGLPSQFSQPGKSILGS